MPPSLNMPMCLTSQFFWANSNSAGAVQYLLALKIKPNELSQRVLQLCKQRN